VVGSPGATLDKRYLSAIFVVDQSAKVVRYVPAEEGHEGHQRQSRWLTGGDNHRVWRVILA
jgi:hypothetical protein